MQTNRKVCRNLLNLTHTKCAWWNTHMYRHAKWMHTMCTWTGLQPHKKCMCSHTYTHAHTYTYTGHIAGSNWGLGGLCPLYGYPLWLYRKTSETLSSVAVMGSCSGAEGSIVMWQRFLCILSWPTDSCVHLPLQNFFLHYLSLDLYF